MTLAMRLNALTLSTRLSVAMIALVVLTAAAIDLLTYRNLATSMVPTFLERTENHAGQMARQLEGYVGGARADVLGFRSAPSVAGIMRARAAGGLDPEGTSEATWRKRLAGLLVGVLDAKPAYHQFRLIGIDDAGRELVRVDRSGAEGAVRVVPDSELQRKGDRDYVTQTLGAPSGQVYVSPIDLNREHGAIETPHVPTMRIATLLSAPDGTAFGILIINLDMRPIFERLRSSARTGGHVFVVNDAGDYLVHADPRREFAFEFDKTSRWQDEFPALATAFAATDPQFNHMISDASGKRFAAAVAPVQFDGAVRAAIIETVPYSVIQKLVAPVRYSILLAGLVAVLGAIILALWLARSLARPLAEMTAAVQNFGREGMAIGPIAGGGEIGALGRAFERMAAEIRDKTTALKAETTERRRIFETSLDLILVVDRRGRCTQVSPSSAAILGYQPEEMIGRNAGDFIYPDDLAQTRNELRAARRGRLKSNFQSRYVHKDGRVVTLTWTGVWSEPEQKHFFFGRDMTEQKEVEENFRLAVESCPSGMVMTDADGKILLVNAETEKLFGYRREELIGGTIDLLVPPRLRGQHPRHRKAFGEHPHARLMGAGRDLFGLRKDGTEFPVEVGLNPIETSDGLVILSVVIDISERKRNERLKDEFVSTVSHELRTPLTSIAASLGLLTGAADSSLPAATKRLITIAHSNSQRLVRLINDILDVEKLESGKVAFDLKRVEVRSLVEQTIEANRGLADQYGVKLTLEPSSPYEMRADSDRLMQVITNLVSNAIKFSPREGEVTVSIEEHDRRVRIGVRDHGPGIPENFRPHIFQKFAQADASDTRQKGGTGLGLSIAKQIVLRLGGEIGFTDAAGGGTIFFVEFPCLDPVGDGAAEANVNGARIMLCEDDRDAAAVMLDRLRHAGFAADVAHTAADALARSATTTYNAILVDLQLPDTDGISLIQQLRARPQYAGTPIIVVSANPGRGREDLRSSNLNILDWLGKPLDIQRLVRTLHPAAARNGRAKLRILHIDDDADVLAAVAQALGSSAIVVSVATITEAQSALATSHFDLAVMDLALDGSSGLDLLSELHDTAGKAVPVIVYSAQGANPACAAKIQAALAKSRGSIDTLVATLRARLASQSCEEAEKEAEEVEPA